MDLTVSQFILLFFKAASLDVSTVIDNIFLFLSPVFTVSVLIFLPWF